MTKILNKIINPIDCKINWEEIWKIPEFKKLQKTKQNPYWHSEGNVDVHTKNVVEAIYELCPIEEGDIVASTGEASKRYEKRYYLTLAALFHDIGKGQTTKWDKDKNTWTAPYHAKASEQITRRLLWDEDFLTREKICSLVGNHMKPLYVLDKKDCVKEVITLAEEYVPLEWLITLKTADCMGAEIQEYDGWKEKLEKVKDIAIKNKCLYKPYEFSSVKDRFGYFNSDKKLNELIHDKFPFNLIVYILIGLPGSGKSTYRKNSQIPVICRDDIRIEMGIQGEKPMGTKEQEDEVTRIVNERIKECINTNTSFIIDATNLKKQYRDNFKKMLSPYNVGIIHVYLEAPDYRANIERRNGQISKHIIDRMRENFEFPKMCESNCLSIIKEKGISMSNTLIF